MTTTTTTLERVGLFVVSIRHDRRPPPRDDGRKKKRKSQFLPSSLGFSQFVGSLSNSMHVLMKHCWPAAHCQRHCCVDDWSIEGPRAFIRKPTLPSRRPPSNSQSLSLSLARNLPCFVARVAPLFWERSIKITRKNPIRCSSLQR